jgi:DNA protecting protein DprA
MSHIIQGLGCPYVSKSLLRTYFSFNGTLRQLAHELISQANLRRGCTDSASVHILDDALRIADFYLEVRHRHDPFSWIAACERTFPVRLNTIRQPPHVLTFLGNPALLVKKSIAIVGARKACTQGLNVARTLARSFGNADVTVVSGGAFGCDSSGHRGALDTAGSTIAVMAGGLKELYPSRLRELFCEIIEQGGLIVSERLFSHQPRPKDFVIRNRIIAGLCDELVLIQAGNKSGALTTAQYAIDLSKDVYVWQADHGDDEAFLGNSRLIEDGAGILRLHGNQGTGNELYFELVEPGHRA